MQQMWKKLRRDRETDRDKTKDNDHMQTMPTCECNMHAVKMKGEWRNKCDLNLR